MSLQLSLLLGVFTIALCHPNPSAYSSEASSDEESGSDPFPPESSQSDNIINIFSTKFVSSRFQSSISYKPILVSEPSVSQEAESSSPVTSMEIEDAPTNHRSFQSTISALKTLPIAAVWRSFKAFFTCKNVCVMIFTISIMATVIGLHSHFAQPDDASPCAAYLPAVDRWVEYNLESNHRISRPGFLLKDAARHRALYQIQYGQDSRWTVYRPRPEHQDDEQGELSENGVRVGKIFMSEFDDDDLVGAVGNFTVRQRFLGSVFQLDVNGTLYRSQENFWRWFVLEKAERLTFPGRGPVPKPLGVVVAKPFGYRLCVPESGDEDYDFARAFALTVAGMAWEINYE